MSEPSEPKPGWEVLASSSAVTALIALVGTALLGPWIAGRIQANNRSHEITLLAYREHLNAELQTVQRAYELAGKYIAASFDLITLTAPEFDTGQYARDRRQVLEDQKDEMRKKYNAVDAEWRHSRESLGFLMGYYHHGRPEITAAWRQVEAAVETYNSCATGWALSHPVATKEQLSTLPCEQHRAAVSDRLAALSKALESGHEYLWKK